MSSPFAPGIVIVSANIPSYMSVSYIFILPDNRIVHLQNLCQPLYLLLDSLSKRRIASLKLLPKENRVPQKKVLLSVA